MIKAWMGLVAVTVAVGSAGAQEEAVRTNGTEVVVTATREWTDVNRTPVSVSVVTADDIERQGAGNLADVLADVPGVQMRSLTGGPIAEAAMRGGGENSQGRVLVLLDGRRLNNPDMASMNWLQIPLNQVERVEVLRGSQTALYGDFAAQGVVNIITRKGRATPEAEVSVLGGSDGALIGRAGVSGPIGGRVPASYAANAEWQTADGYRDNSGYESYGAGGRVSADASDRFGASAGGSWYFSRYELPGDLSLEEMKRDRRMSHNPDDESENEYRTASVDLFAEPAEGVRLDLGLGWLDKRNEADVPSWFMFSDTDTESASFQPKMTVDWRLAGMAQRTSAGVDLFLDRLTVERYGDKSRSARMLEADLERKTVGGYFRHQTEVSAGWILHLSGRVEQSDLSVTEDAGGLRILDDEKTHHASAAEGGLAYAFDSGSKAFARIGGVYRYPFLDEQVSYYGYGADAFYQEVESEKGMNAEAGLELGFHPDWRFAATLFRLAMRDEVAWDPIAYRNANLDKTLRQGVELQGWWHPLARLEVLADYTYTDAEFDAGPNDGRDVPLVAEHRASGTVRIGLWPERVFLDATVRYTGRAPLGGDVANVGPRLSDYTVLDLALRYQGKGMSAFIGLDNAGDESYAAVGYKGWDRDAYYPMPGRSWRAGVTKRF